MKTMRWVMAVMVVMLVWANLPTAFASPLASASSANSPTLQSSTILVVSPSGPYLTLTAALADAQAGDTIEVRGGQYPALVVDKSVTLEGRDWPVIDGGGQGTVVTLSAPNIVFRGFEVRGSGIEPDHDHAGITLTAADIVIENNRLVDVLFGIFVSQADRAVLRGNDITSKAEFDAGRRGDGIRVWYSTEVLIENNHLHGARDVVLWYAQNLVMRGNVLEHGRYGAHLMYCDGAVIEDNQFLSNAVGVYTMYSTDVILRRNVMRGHHGSSGYALGFKDAENVTVTDNVLVDNQAGLFLDGTPFSPTGYGHFENNLIAFNNVGAMVLPAVRGNVFTHNTFWENVEQMALQGGGGKPAANIWAGNYWSDYTGYDADGDGLGDTPYVAERFFENLMDTEPKLRAVLYSPAVQTLEMAAAAFPLIKPQPKFTDFTPSLRPNAIPDFARVLNTSAGPLVAVSVALLLLVIACVLSARGEFRMTSSSAIEKSSAPPLEVRGLSKNYGALKALTDVSFTALPGEAIALWGANGAGKTTLIKAILGLLDFEGAIRVQGQDVRRAGKQARRAIGYVPQEVMFYEASVQATLEFYARLKHVNTDRIPTLLERLGLTAHARKPVPALSGGLRQRLALAVALLADPPVLLLDEPTANLDARAQRDYLNLLIALRKEEHKTIIFASHRLEEVEALASRVLMLELGEAVQMLDPLELLRVVIPEIELTLWIPEVNRDAAVTCLTNEGLTAHLNGRGTVVVRVRTEDKMAPWRALSANDIPVLDFVERGRMLN